MKSVARTPLAQARSVPGAVVGLSIAIAICIAITGGAGPAVAETAVAEELRPGVTFSAGTRVAVAEYGVSFVVPEGWSGELTPDQTAFLMTSDAIEAGALVASGEKSTPEEALREMSAEIPIGGGLVLEPLGELDRGVGFASRDFAVRGAVLPSAAYARVIFHEGAAISFLALVPEQRIAEARRWVADLHESLRLAAPVPAAPAAGEVAAGSGTTDRWDDYLRGKHLVRFYTTTGYTSERHLWLCSDGSFAYRDQSGGFGGGASGAFDSSSRGRWTATGVGDEGGLRLEYADGSVAEYELTFRDGKVMLDGDHWLRDGNDFCR